MFTTINANGKPHTVHLLLGGPTRKIQVHGKVYTFEMHRYSGPMLLKRDGEPAKNNPMPFLEAASLWAQQGEKIDENGLCIWHHPPEPITEHMGGRHYKVVGYTEPRKGE